LDTNFITPPKSNIDSNNSSPTENEMNSQYKKNISDNNVNHNEKDKETESAWTKFINVIFLFIN